MGSSIIISQKGWTLPDQMQKKKKEEEKEEEGYLPNTDGSM